MKVLRVIPTLDPEMGGPQTTIINSAIAERQADIEPTIVFAGDDRSRISTAPALERLQAAGIQAIMFPRAHGLPASAVSRWGISRQMTAWLLRNVGNYDVIHVDYVWPWSTLVAAIAGSRAQRPVVMTAHESLTSFDIESNVGADSYKVRGKLWLRGLLMRSVDLLIMTSDIEYADSVRRNEHAVVVPHAVVAEPLEQPLAEPPLPPLVIGYIGRLHPKKNVDVLLRAVARLGSGTRLIVCGTGDPSYRARLHDLAAELSISTAVDWRGHVDARGRAELFAKSHVVAMPSTYECFGMAAAEAMAVGVPVIVSKTTGVAPVVEEYRCGKLVNAGDLDDVCDALISIASNAQWRAQARVNALRAASTVYSYEAYGSQMAAIYTQLSQRQPLSYTPPAQHSIKTV